MFLFLKNSFQKGNEILTKISLPANSYVKKKRL